MPDEATTGSDPRPAPTSTAPEAADAVDGLLFVGNGKTDNEFFGRILRTCRRELDKSAREVADEVGVSATFVRAIERGDQAPSEDTARRLWDVVNPGFPDGRTRPRTPDLVITDPDTDMLYVCEFTASRKGDNSKWSLDRLRGSEPGKRLADSYMRRQLLAYLSASRGMPLPTADTPDQALENFAQVWETWMDDARRPRQSELRDTDVEPPNRMELLGRLTIRLVEADMQTLLRVDETLAVLSRQGDTPVE